MLGASAAQAQSGIEQGELPAIPGAGAASGEIGLAGEPWSGIGAEEARKILGRLALPPASATLADLLRRLLADPGGATDPGLVAVRLEALMRTGAFAELRTLAAAGGKGLAGSSVMEAEAALALGDDEAGCGIARDAASAGGAGREIQTRAILATAFCSAAKGDAAAAGLVADLLRDQGVEAPLPLAALEAIAENKTAKLPTGAEMGLIELKYLALLGDRAGTRLAQPLPPGLAAALAAETRVGPELRLDAAERAAAGNALSPDRLLRLYGEVKLPREALANPLASALEGPMQRALLSQAAAASEDRARKARLVRALAASLDADDLGAVSGAVLAPLLRELAPGPDLAWLTDTAVEALIAAGEIDAAAAWDEAGRAAGPDPTRWRMPIDLGARQSPQDRAAALSEAEQMAADNLLEPETLQRLVTVLDALEYNIPIPLWQAAAALPQSNAGHLPETGLLSRLQAAAEQRQAGRVILLVASALGGDRPSESHLLALGDSIRALKAVGLEPAARRLAVEAVLPLWPRASP